MTELQKRPRKVVNYADMDANEISDEDDFAGFSSSGESVTKKQTKNNLRKKSKLSKLSSGVSEPEEDATEEQPKRSYRIPLQEKIFQRELQAALELSLIHNSVIDNSSISTNKTSVLENDSLKPVLIPVDVHQEMKALRPTSFSEQSFLAPCENKSQLKSEAGVVNFDVITAEESNFENTNAVESIKIRPTTIDCTTVSKPINRSEQHKKNGKRKATVIDSDEEEFSIKNETDTTHKKDILHDKLGDANKFDLSTKNDNLLTKELPSDKTRRSIRNRRPIQIIPDLENDTDEEEWAEESDDDNISDQSSDFSPPKNSVNKGSDSVKKTTGRIDNKKEKTAKCDMKFGCSKINLSAHLNRNKAGKSKSPTSITVPTIRAAPQDSAALSDSKAQSSNSTRISFECPSTGASVSSQYENTKSSALIPLSAGRLRLGLSRKANYKPLHPNACLR